MKEIISILIFFFLTINCHSQWFVKYKFPADKKMEYIQFINDNTGWVCENEKKIYKTTDGGRNWFTFYEAVCAPKFKFINENTGYILGYNTNTILKTTNGGLNWRVIPTGAPLIGVDIDANAQGCVGLTSFKQGIFSTDFGETFTITNIPTTYQNGKIVCAINPKLFLIGPSDYNFYPLYYFYTKTDLSTLYVGDPYTFLSFMAFSYVDENKICFVTDGKFYITTTGPENFVSKSLIINAYDVDFVSDSALYVLSRYKFVFRTSNYGNNWIQQTLPVNYGFRLWNINFPSDNVGYISCDSGYILKTTNGGIVPVIQNNEEIPESFNLYQNYPNPFNSTTRISYNIPKSSNISLKVYDINGHLIETIFKGIQKAGEYVAEFNTSELPSGIYFYVLEAEKNKEVKKMTLIK